MRGRGERRPILYLRCEERGARAPTKCVRQGRGASSPAETGGPSHNKYLSVLNFSTVT